MPVLGAKTIVTWNGADDGDAHREAKRLVACYPLQSVLVKSSALHDLTAFNCIIVTHRSDLAGAIPAIAQITRTVSSWVVLAGCSSAAAEYVQTLADNELLSPAQRLAQMLGEGTRVDGTTRPLTFKEVGEGLAFAPTLQAVIVPTEYPNGVDSKANPLWKTAAWRPEDVDHNTDMLQKL